ncbi:MAG TPA: DUF2589 domain-containing protein [Burkholderiales bacterium]|nr:DUF2589 domain-containing protein [Burkholderiales bacterium]
MTPLPLRELLGILVGDLIVAETQAAKATADFLREAGFLGDGNADHWGKLRFVTFSFSVQDLSGEKVRTVRVPLLSLLPIPLQQIDQAEYEFFAKVNEVKKIEPAPKASYELGSAAYGLAQPFFDLVCEVAPYFPESTLNKRDAPPKVRVKLTMRQSDLPAGLASSLRRIEETSGSKTS